jgi:hypothetical protein
LPRGEGLPVVPGLIKRQKPENLCLSKPLTALWDWPECAALANWPPAGIA